LVNPAGSFSHLPFGLTAILAVGENEVKDDLQNWQLAGGR
jgi:hypothetical protein